MLLFRKSYETLRFAVAADLEVKATDEGVIVGYASTFGGEPDNYGDVVAPGAFTASLAAHKAGGTAPAMLWSHDQSEPVGRWRRFEEDKTGLLAEGTLNLKTARGREAYEHVKAGDTTGLSIGFQVPQGGQEYVGNGVTLLKAVSLAEVSIVTIPANSRARVMAVKSLANKSELVDLLREAGLSKTAAGRVAAGGWPALSGQDHQKAIDLAAEIERATSALRSI